MALQFLTSPYTWKLMLDANATTTLEAWTKKDKPNPSWSHPWCSAPANAIPRFLMGVYPLESDFARFMIQPQPGNLTWASLSLQIPPGRLHLGINQTSEAIAVNIVVPPTSSAKVCLPAPLLRPGLNRRGLNVDGKLVDS